MTVAKELARLTSFKVFHNHLTVDLVESVFQRGTPPFAELIWGVRLSVFAKAAEAEIDGLIFTMVYERNREALMSRCVAVVEEAGGEVCFVHLTCTPETLGHRIGNDNRKRHGKIVSGEVLNTFLRNAEARSPFAAAVGWESLTIDTEQASPAEAAAQIVKHYSLKAKI